MAETNTILSLCFPCPTPAQAGQVDETQTNTFLRLCEDIGASHHCQVLLDVSLHSSQAKKRLSIESHQSVYNVTLTGAYQNVMVARGALMRQHPLKPRLSIKVPKDAITADPFFDHDDKNSQDDSTQTKTDSPNDTRILAHLLPNLSSSERNPPPATATSFSPYFSVLPRFKSAVDLISATTSTTITLLSSHFHALPSTRSGVAAHARQEMVELVVSGSWENAEAARLLLLATIDVLKPKVVAERIQVDQKFQNIIGGRKRQNLQELMARTRTSIYLASPFVPTTSNNDGPLESLLNDIIITGEKDMVQLVKDSIMRAYNRVQTTAPVYTRQVNIASRKLDWMLLNQREKLRSIMIDNASFIAFPPLGASHPLVVVYGESRVNVERTIRTVMQLSSNFHSGSVNVLSPVRESLVAMPPNSSVLSPVANISKLVSQASGAEVEFRNNGFFIYGSEIQTRIAVQFLADVDFVKTMHYEVKFSVELANEHREFISGKKNGKVNRIMKTTGAKIKFDPCNEYNFYVDLSSTIAIKAVEALVLLQEELPAEISFYVPETYHKRIIGVGGKNIQRIMKKFGVYVKFSNSEEFANLGGYFDNLDNVVARTPSKNAMNLDNLKHAVMELVNPKDKDYVHHSLSIPRQYHLSLLSDHAKALNELQDATNATIRFPEKESGSDTVWISGPESLIQQATSMLLSLVDEQYVYPVPFSEAMDRVLSKPEFKTEVADRMRIEWNMTLVPPPTHQAVAVEKKSNGNAVEVTLGSKPASPAPPSAVTATSARNEFDGAGAAAEDGEENKDIQDLTRSLSSLTDSDDDDEEDHLFVFKYSRNNEDYLQNAKELLVQFLIDNQIEVYDDEIHVQRPRSDSFAEAFPHFNSKILSSVGATELPTPAPAFLNYSLFDNAGTAFDTLSRTPGSGMGGQNSSGPGAGSMVAPDIRALFPHGPSPGLPPLSTSPPRWPEQHSRQLTSVSGSSSNYAATSVIASGPSFSPVQPPSSGQHSTSSFNRLTSLPIDPWASPSKQASPSPHQHQQHSPGFPGSIGQFRTPPPGMNTSSSHYYSSNHQQLFSPEGPYSSNASGYQTPGSTSLSHYYSNNSSPVQGVSSNGHSFGSKTGQHPSQSPHQPSPQRPISGSSTDSRDSLQFLEENSMPGPAFGPGYGPSLNNGNVRTHQQHMIYQQQQQQQQQQPVHGQSPYPALSNFGQSIQYPQSRQRHSSHNSATSHHTMFLGPIGGGLGSAGGSVNSDDISTEDEGDESFDDARNRYRTHTQSYQQQQAQHQSFGSYGSSANRRGSVPSMGSMYSNQQSYHPGSPQHPQQQQNRYSPVTPPPSGMRQSNSHSDLYSRKSLVSAMARHSIGQQDNNISANRALGGLGGPLPGVPGNSGLSSGSVFGNERDLFSSGLGGILGGGTAVSHQGNGNSFGSTGHTVGSALSGASSSSLPFLAESPLDRLGQPVAGGSGWKH